MTSWKGSYEDYAPQERVTRRTVWHMFRVELTGFDFAQPATTPYRVTIRHGDLEKLILGLCVMDMDHKWIFLTDGPDRHGLYVVNLVRSWTGIPLIKLNIRSQLDEDRCPRTELDAHMEEIVWEKDESKWPIKDFLPSAERTKEFVRGLCDWLLEIKVPAEDAEAN